MKVSKKFADSDKTYTPIWNKIKTNKLEPTVVSCPPANVARLKKALAKEKDQDTTWPEKRYYKLVSKPHYIGDVVCGLEFKLVIYRERELATELIIRTTKSGGTNE